MPRAPIASVLSCLALTLVITVSPAHAQQPSFDAIAWWEGCWERTSSGNRRRVERWHALKDNEMKGGSRSFADTVETGGERLRVTMVDGKLVYHAHPSNQSAQRFTATAVSAAEVTFENLAHDFPQRIIYTKRGADSLLARIEGDRAGRQQPVTFAFRSIDCAGHGESPVDVVEEALRPFYADLTSRLQAHPQGTPGWFVKNAAPGFLYVNYGAPGYLARTGSQRTQESAAQAVANAVPPTLTDYTARVEIATVLARGDSAEVLVITRQSLRAGPAGQQRVRSSEQRRLDRWVRRAGEWKLVSATVVNDEQYLDGQLNAKNGVPVLVAPPR